MSVFSGSYSTQGLLGGSVLGWSLCTAALPEMSFSCQVFLHPSITLKTLFQLLSPVRLSAPFVILFRFIVLHCFSHVTWGERPLTGANRASSSPASWSLTLKSSHAWGAQVPLPWHTGISTLLFPHPHMGKLRLCHLSQAWQTRSLFSQTHVKCSLSPLLVGPITPFTRTHISTHPPWLPLQLSSHQSRESFLDWSWELPCSQALLQLSILWVPLGLSSWNTKDFSLL